MPEVDYSVSVSLNAWQARGKRAYFLFQAGFFQSLLFGARTRGCFQIKAVERASPFHFHFTHPPSLSPSTLRPPPLSLAANKQQRCQFVVRELLRLRRFGKPSFSDWAPRWACSMYGMHVTSRLLSLGLVWRCLAKLAISMEHEFHWVQQS